MPLSKTLIEFQPFNSAFLISEDQKVDLKKMKMKIKNQKENEKFKNSKKKSKKKIKTLRKKI